MEQGTKGDGVEGSREQRGGWGGVEGSREQREGGG